MEFNVARFFTFPQLVTYPIPIQANNKLPISIN